MKNLLIFSFIMLIPLICFAVDNFISPNPSKTTSLTVYGTPKNHTLINRFGINPASGTSCTVRLLPTSTNSSSYVRIPITKTNDYTIFKVNKLFPYANLSSCTGGTYIAE